MRRPRRGSGLLALPLLLAVLCAGSTTRAAEAPAVARAAMVGPGQNQASGTAFFLERPDAGGVVAVAAAHSLEPSELFRAREVEFRLGRSRERVAASSRLLVSPGRPFSAPGGTVRDDFLVFALDGPLQKVRTLVADPALPTSGRRVQILGVPAQIPTDEDDLFGSVVASSDEKIEVALDATADLRGWGGAPVLDHGSKRVLGILQAAWPKGGTLHVAVSPIAAVTAALAAPLDAGRGRDFASFAGEPAPLAVTPAGVRPTPSSVSDSPPAPAPAASVPSPSAPAPSVPGGPAATVAATSRGSDDVPSGDLPLRPSGEGLLGTPTAVGPVGLKLSVERPTDGEIVGDASGAFVAGRALATSGDLKHFDVMIVIDTSGSTFEPTGADVNGNGVVGTATFGGLFGIGSTDPGDSILAAEVAAAHQLLAGLDPRSTRVGLVTFAGEPEGQGGLFGGAPPPAAITEEPLTTEYDRIRRGLQGVAQRGPAGATHMAAGADQATIELKGLAGGLSQTDPKSEKIVLFLTDGQPTLPAGPGFDAVNVNAVLRAAERARRAGVRFHAFAIGPEALAGPVAAVELAARTGGYFTPVRNPGDIVEVVEQVRFSKIEKISLLNLSTGETASQVVVKADGTFGGLVPLQAGLNRVEVTAVAEDGAKASQIVQVSYVPGTASPALPRELMAMRNRLLEQKLVELRRDRADVERDSVEETRKELALEVERERAAANAAAERQRKDLQLEVERTPDASP